MPSTNREFGVFCTEWETRRNRIFLSISGMSTVKIRTGSLFCNTVAALAACRADLGRTHSNLVSERGESFRCKFSSFVHRIAAGFTACTQRILVSYLREMRLRVQSQR